MSNEMITQLPNVISAQMTDIIYAVQNYVSPSSPGTSVQETLQQVFNLFNTNFILNNPGNPNGAVAGTIFQLLWDSTDHILYICTTAGSSSTAVWTPVIGQLTNGQMRIGSTGNPPSSNTLTAGANITISNGPGTITISSAGGVGFTWNDQTSNPTNMVSNNGYVTDSASLITLLLPPSSNFGDILRIVGRGAGGWSITQGTGQQIIVGSASTTSGAGGSLSSTNRRDSIALVCTLANLEWTAESAPQSAGLTIV